LLREVVYGGALTALGCDIILVEYETETPKSSIAGWNHDFLQSLI
jgi:hypothetical protein